VNGAHLDREHLEPVLHQQLDVVQLSVHSHLADLCKSPRQHFMKLLCPRRLNKTRTHY
jgi:hypothetical protein